LEDQSIYSALAVLVNKIQIGWTLNIK